MIQQTTIGGRPATVMYINDAFEPVEQADATLVRVNFKDEQGGSAFLVRSPGPAKRISAQIVRSQRMNIARNRAKRLLKYHGENPDERDEAGRFAPTGGGGGGAAEKPSAAPQAPAAGGKVTLADFEKSDINVDVDPSFKEQFTDRWNDRIQMSPDAFRDKFLGGIKGDMTLDYQGKNDVLVMVGNMQDESGENIGEYASEIDFKNNRAEAVGMEFTSETQGKGLGKKFMAGQIAAFWDAGLDGVDLRAGLDVGGYAWAKYGWVPSEESWDNELKPRLSYFADYAIGIQHDEKNGLSSNDRAMMKVLANSADPKALWAIADAKNERGYSIGKRWLMGHGWSGSLMFDDAVAMKRFNAYVGKA